MIIRKRKMIIHIFYLKTYNKMITEKKIQSLGMPWEKEYGYAQAVMKGYTAWLAGQVGHDDKGMLAEAWGNK